MGNPEPVNPEESRLRYVAPFSAPGGDRQPIETNLPRLDQCNTDEPSQQEEQSSQDASEVQ